MRILLALFLTASLATSVSAADWTHLRGPGLDGKVTGSGLFDEGTPALELAWRVPLGSGYSGIAVAGGKVVTLFTRGDEDWIGAFGLLTTLVWLYIEMLRLLAKLRSD